MSWKKREDIHKEDLIKRYTDNGELVKDIARDYNIHPSTMLHHFNKFNIKTMNYNGRHNSNINLSGKRVGNIEIISKRENRSSHNCRCDCGNYLSINTQRLIDGRVKSCGCIKKWKGYGEISQSYWYNVGVHAKIKNRKLILTIQDAWELFLKQERKCALSGEILMFVRDYRKDKKKQTASLDRINSDGDYEINNVQWLHKDINLLKGPLLDSKLIELSYKISQNNQNKMEEVYIY